MKAWKLKMKNHLEIRYFSQSNSYILVKSLGLGLIIYSLFIVSTLSFTCFINKENVDNNEWSCS